jgi:hypothetical protein
MGTLSELGNFESHETAGSRGREDEEGAMARATGRKDNWRPMREKRFTRKLSVTWKRNQIEREGHRRNTPHTEITVYE